jgi:hypothetical protein
MVSVSPGRCSLLLGDDGFADACVNGGYMLGQVLGPPPSSRAPLAA